LRLLADSAQKLPNNPEIQYHLGMAQAKMNQSAEAKHTLERALAMSSNFAGRDEAQKARSQLD
jgi:TolA-binding protein